jgi:hypothetical protein
MISNLWFDHGLLICFLVYELFSLVQYKLLHLTFILSKKICHRVNNYRLWENYSPRLKKNCFPRQACAILRGTFSPVNVKES